MGTLVTLRAEWTPLGLINLRMSQISVEIEAFATSRERDELVVEEVNAAGAVGYVTEVEDIFDKMDMIDTLTYLVVGLGVLVLGLCVVVASLIIYQHCRKLKRAGYAPVHQEWNHCQLLSSRTTTREGWGVGSSRCHCK